MNYSNQGDVMKFVNIHGHEVDTSIKKEKKKAANFALPYHKGWLVEGIPPGALEAAKDGHLRVEQMAERAGGRTIEPFDEANWLMNAKLKRVRSKPYEIESSAQECARLAERAGWLRVMVTEKKRGE